MEDEMKSASETQIVFKKNSSYIVKKMIDTTVTRLTSQRSF